MIIRFKDIAIWILSYLQPIKINECNFTFLKFSKKLFLGI